METSGRVPRVGEESRMYENCIHEAFIIMIDIGNGGRYKDSMVGVKVGLCIVCQNPILCISHCRCCNSKVNGIERNG